MISFLLIIADSLYMYLSARNSRNVLQYQLIIHRPYFRHLICIICNMAYWICLVYLYWNESHSSSNIIASIKDWVFRPISHPWSILVFDPSNKIKSLHFIRTRSSWGCVINLMWETDDVELTLSGNRVRRQSIRLGSSLMWFKLRVALILKS